MTAYQAEAGRKSDLERTELAKKKTGVFTGAYAINPVNQEKIPIWIADYVLAGYGSGAIMAVPGHDERDFAFANEFGLPIRTVIRPPDEWLKRTQSTLENLQEAYVGEGEMINSGPFNGRPSSEWKDKVADWLQERGQGTRKINYKLRDWLFSRQRYWGTFPILHEWTVVNRREWCVPWTTNCPCLPDLADYRPSGERNRWARPPTGSRSNEARAPPQHTMPQWAGSCWYYPLYLDPSNDKQLCGPATRKLLDGGGSHVAAPGISHLLYALAQGAVRSRPRSHARAICRWSTRNDPGEMEFTAFHARN